MAVKPMPGRRITSPNQSLEYLIEELTKYGLPVIHPYMDKSSEDNFRLGKPVKADKWTCRINTPHNKHDRDPNPSRKKEHDTHMVPQGFGGDGITPKAAVSLCLRRVKFYYSYGWKYTWPIERKPKNIPDCSDLM